MVAMWSVLTLPMREVSYKKAARNEQLNTETRAEKSGHVFSNRRDVLIRFSALGGYLVRAWEKTYQGSFTVNFHMLIFYANWVALFC